jgi:hypothetical protein
MARPNLLAQKALVAEASQAIGGPTWVKLLYKGIPEFLEFSLDPSTFSFPLALFHLEPCLLFYFFFSSSSPKTAPDLR